MVLHKLTNSELNLKMRSLFQQECELLGDVILHVKEVSRRRHYLEMGYSSLYTYMTEYLGYAGGSAQRRIDAAALSNEIPEVVEMLETGIINLSHTTMIQQSARVVQRNTKDKVTTTVKKDLLFAIKDLSKEKSQVLVAQALDIPILLQQKFSHQRDESVRMEVTFTKDQWRKVQEMQAILSNSVASSDLVSTVVHLAEKVIQKHKGKSIVMSGIQSISVSTSTATVAVNGEAQSSTAENLCKQTRSCQPSQDQSSQLGQEPSNRHKQSIQPKPETYRKAISIKTKRHIFSQFPSCQYKNRHTGKICGSRWHLNIEHKHPLWANGGNEIENLSVLCSQHNQLVYKKQSGIRIEKSSS